MRASGSIPLAMACPHCRAYGAHPVLRAVPNYCSLPTRVARVLGSFLGRATMFRAIEKQCLECGAVFRLAQVPQDDLFALAQKFAELVATHSVVEEELEQAREEVTRLLAMLRGGPADPPTTPR